jgi:hypothetical protein
VTVGLVLAAWLVIGLVLGIVVGKTIRYGHGPDDD